MAEPVCTIDDFGPLPIVRPQSVAELRDVVRKAAAERQALYPLGGQTVLGIGKPPTRPGIAVDMTGLAEVIDYPARDMTITVEAGITIDRLQSILSKEKQQLAVDVPAANRATLGGAIATNASGPRRLGHCTLRDHVIGISVVNDRGQVAKAGGRVVKNVAGYDLCKLHTGALGTLGIISQVTLKLRPIPEQQVFFTIPCPKVGDLGPLLDQLHGTRCRPTSVTVVSPRASTVPADGAWMILVGLEGVRETVEWQLAQLGREFPGDRVPSGTSVITDRVPVLKALTDFPVRCEYPLTFKANLLPGATANFCQQAAALLGDDLLLQAEAASGIVVGHAPALTLDQATAMLNSLRQTAVTAHGNLVLLRCPTAWKTSLPVWGAPRGDLALMRAVKHALDPDNLFNPGRFLV